jgi:hypothetical protein
MYRGLIENCGRTIRWQRYFWFATPPAAEIDQRPVLTAQKARLTCERYTIDSKVLNTNTKQFSTNRLVTSFPVCDVV